MDLKDSVMADVASKHEHRSGVPWNNTGHYFFAKTFLASHRTSMYLHTPKQTVYLTNSALTPEWFRTVVIPTKFAPSSVFLWFKN